MLNSADIQSSRGGRGELKSIYKQLNPTIKNRENRFIWRSKIKKIGEGVELRFNISSVSCRRLSMDNVRLYQDNGRSKTALIIGKISGRSYEGKQKKR